MPCFGMGLKEKIQSSRRRKSNASTASHTSDSGNAESESMAVSDTSPLKKANRLPDVAGTAKAANPELKAENSVDTAVSVAPGDVSDPTMSVPGANHHSPQPLPTNSSGHTSMRWWRSKSPARYTPTKCTKRCSPSSMSRCGRPDISCLERTVVLWKYPRSKSPTCTGLGKQRQRRRGKVSGKHIRRRKRGGGARSRLSGGTTSARVPANHSGIRIGKGWSPII